MTILFPFTPATGWTGTEAAGLLATGAAWGVGWAVGAAASWTMFPLIFNTVTKIRSETTNTTEWFQHIKTLESGPHKCTANKLTKSDIHVGCCCCTGFSTGFGWQINVWPSGIWMIWACWGCWIRICWGVPPWNTINYGWKFAWHRENRKLKLMQTNL